MYGHLNIVLKHYVLERHGEEKWNSILKEANHGGEFNENEKHDDTLTQNLINAAVNILCLKREAFLHLLGEYFLAYLRSNGYDELVRNWGSDILEFAQNLDSVQSFLKSEYQDIVTPSFRCDDDSVSDRMVLHYYSIRPGYQDFVMGFITSAAKTLYQMELNISVLSVSNEEVANENGFREHVVFNIIAKKIADAMDESTPTFVAQTQKNSERQILKDDVDAVRRKLEQIRKELGEEALPVQKYRSAKAKWKAIAKISLLSRGFVPNYPQLTAVNPKMFIDIFPYHLILDSEMKVYQSGIKIQKMMPSIRSRLATVTEFFTIRYPQCTDLTYDNIKKFIMCPFILEFKKERISKDYASHHPFLVKGQMFVLIDKGFLFFICSPLVRCWYDLEQRKMKLAEIPIWDATRDFLLTDIATSINTWTMNQAGVSHEGMAGHGIGSNEALARIQKDLDNERQKNDALYHAFLPRQIANMVRSGQIPDGVYYPEVTALFCDVVHFLNMVRTCKPNDVVGVLNSLYARFDKVTRVHDTYRVESIGDAYFVVAGMPEKIPNHAERMANTALGMMYLTQEVASPITGEKLQIRIGMHTGSMVSGVVGRRLPRYIVLGETAVVASKMESHGEPGKIHISPATYRLLKGKGYSMEERGKIELRGIGPIATFFLVGNDNVSEDVLVGRPKVTAQEIKFINEGKQQDPSKNKKANMTPSSGVGSRPPTGDSEIITFSY